MAWPMVRAWLPRSLSLGVVLCAAGISGAAILADDGSGGGDPARASLFSRCQWVVGPTCSLGAEPGAVCTMSATCPSGTKVVSGACEGFTSVSIGRSAPDTGETAWSCAVSRLSSIRNPNQLAARALCCP
jgi:hypothetical protein